MSSWCSWRSCTYCYKKEKSRCQSGWILRNVNYAICCYIESLGFLGERLESKRENSSRLLSSDCVDKHSLEWFWILRRLRVFILFIGIVRCWSSVSLDICTKISQERPHPPFASRNGKGRENRCFFLRCYYSYPGVVCSLLWWHSPKQKKGSQQYFGRFQLFW